MASNLDGSSLKSDSANLNGNSRGACSTVEFVEEPLRDPDSPNDSTFPNRLIVADAFRIDGYRLRYGIGHGLSLVYYEEDKIQQAIKEFDDVFKSARNTSNNAKILQNLYRLQAQLDRDNDKAAPQRPSKLKGRKYKSPVTA